MNAQVGQETEPGRGLLVAGAWVRGEGGTAPVLRKFDGYAFTTVDLPSREQVGRAARAAKEAYRAAKLSPFERGEILDRAAEIMAARAARLEGLLVMEAGFTLTDAANEVRRTVQTFRLSAEEARRIKGEVVPIEGAPGQNGRMGWTVRVPLGVVCAITPFNAPLNTVAHKVAPALAAGNAVILKPSQHTPLVGCEMADALIDAGLPKGLITVLHGGAEVVQWLLDEDSLDFYAFTGSTRAGRAGLRRTQMELGSIAFAVVADDAKLDSCLNKVVNAAYRKAGQVCTSVQILLVHQAVFAEVKTRLTQMVKGLRFGDPAAPGTFVGPVISSESAQRIESWIAQAVKQGATCLVGGTRHGNVIAPTLLTDVDDSMAVGCEEVFGPVMSLVPYATTDEAIARINATPYGLATGVFTNRLNDAFRFVRELQVGGIHINETSSSRVDMMPYGGSKDSGFGREGPRYAMREMSEERIVTIIAET